MRWPGRHLFNVCAAVSLLLCVTAIVLSAAFRRDGTLVLRDGGGGVWGGSLVATYELFRSGGWVGLGWARSDAGFEQGIEMPISLIVVLTAVLPLAWALRHARERRTMGRGFGVLPANSWGKLYLVDVSLEQVAANLSEAERRRVDAADVVRYPEGLGFRQTPEGWVGMEQSVRRLAPNEYRVIRELPPEGRSAGDKSAHAPGEA